MRLVTEVVLAKQIKDSFRGDMKLIRAIVRKGLLVLICSLLIAFQFALAAPPAAPIGRVSGRGPVLLNGVPAPAGSNVYAGNRIATGRRAAVYVALARGGKLVFGGSTIARVVENASGFSVALDRGVVGAVSDSSAPVLIEARGVTVRTKDPAGAYQVSLSGNTLRVLARNGGAIVDAANRTVELAPGKLMNASVDPKTDLSNKKKVFVGVLTGVAVVSAAVGIALSYPTKTCKTVSPSGFSCQ